MKNRKPLITLIALVLVVIATIVVVRNKEANWAYGVTIDSEERGIGTIYVAKDYILSDAPVNPATNEAFSADEISAIQAGAKKDAAGYLADGIPADAALGISAFGDDDTVYWFDADSAEKILAQGAAVKLNAEDGTLVIDVEAEKQLSSLPTATEEKAWAYAIASGSKASGVGTFYVTNSYLSGEDCVNPATGEALTEKEIKAIQTGAQADAEGYLFEGVPADAAIGATASGDKNTIYWFNAKNASAALASGTPLTLDASEGAFLTTETESKKVASPITQEAGMFEIISKLLSRYGYMFVDGLKVTLVLSAIAVILGLPIGACIAIMRMSTFKNPVLNRFNPLKLIASIYVEVLRGTPLLLQLYFFYFLLPNLVTFVNLDSLQSIAIALIVNSSAYVSEVIRSGIQAVDRGQTEAARTLGLNGFQTMLHIVLPQAVKNILPALCNEFVSIIKETSLASTFFIGDLMTQYNTIRGVTYRVIEPLIIVGCIYLVVTFTLSKLISVYERRLKVGD